jgi:predicted MFS family arabinose efflux permease
MDSLGARGLGACNHRLHRDAARCNKAGHGTVGRELRATAIWIGIFIGSTIGGLIPELWGDGMFSYSGVLLSGGGAFVGLWLGSRASRS